MCDGGLVTDITLQDGEDAINVAMGNNDGTQVTVVLPYCPQGEGAEPLIGEMTAYAS